MNLLADMSAQTYISASTRKQRPYASKLVLII